MILIDGISRDYAVGMSLHAASILFDESHGEAWTIEPDRAAAMRPERPADASFARAAALLAADGYSPRSHHAGELGDEVLADVGVLVIAHPSDARFEHTVGGSPVFTAREIAAVERFVGAGGGLVVLGETEHDKYGTNLNELLASFGISIVNETVYDYESHTQVASWVRAAPSPAGPAGLLSRVDETCFYRAGTLELSSGARAVLATSSAAAPPGRPLAAIADHGRGRVVVLSDSDLFGDDCIGEHDHEELWRNLVTWAALPHLASELAPVESPLVADPAWGRLKATVEGLRLLQNADGSADDVAAVRPLVALAQAAVGQLARYVPHEAEYLAAVSSELDAWVAGGCARPDFTSSLELFRPDLHRVDGIEHLVVFPLYTQNGSPDTRFEALCVRVPWPAWLAELEATRYDNPAFVPVTFVDYTSGYDSECAVLFPETVAVAGPPANHFGGIFCDREAARMQRVAAQAAELLRLNLPPDAERLLVSAPIARDAFALWDLIHDRAHSHGDLPFDPFMIRQRMPFWMYTLEELRCDLTAFAEAVELELGGLASARNVQYAVLFDRLFRFPITGGRVRNYDGLGGQLLFAYLHRQGLVRWTDNQLRIDWKGVAAGVVELRGEVEELYRGGIDKPRVAHWLAAHELVARYVAPHVASRWADGAQALTSEDDPRAWVDAVLDDEFPLSIFYSSLQQKLDVAALRRAA